MILVALFIFTWMRKLETDEKYRGWFIYFNLTNWAIFFNISKFLISFFISRWTALISVVRIRATVK